MITNVQSMIQASTITKKKVPTNNITENVTSDAPDSEDTVAGLNDLMERIMKPKGEKQKKGEEDEDQFFSFSMKGAKKRAAYAIVSWLIYVALALLIWFVCYPNPPVPVSSPSEIEDPKITFTEGHFECISNPGICLCACLCPGLRWADTMNSANLLPITIGLSLAFGASLLNGLLWGGVILGPATIALGLYYRHQLRAVLKLTSFTFSTCLLDAMFLGCCPWCAIAQEARAVNHALMKGILRAP